MPSFLRKCAYLVCVLLLASPVAAQTNSVPRGTAFKIAADHDGKDTTSYRLYRDGVVVTNKSVSALVAGVITFDEPTTVPDGAHVYEVSAMGPGGEAKSGAPITVTVVTPPPTAPKNLRFTLAVVVAQDGTLTFQLVPSGL